MDFEQICLAKELEKNKLRLHLYEITFPQGCLFPILKYNTESLSSNHLPIDVYPALTPFFDSIVFRRRTALLSLFQTWMQKFICPSRYFYATFIVNFDKNTASTQRDDVKKRCVGRIPEKDYQFPVCAQEILSSRAQRTGHRSSATFSSDRKQTLSLSLSLEGISRCRRIFGKRNTQKKRGNWTAVGLTHVRPSTSRDATLSDNRILRRCRGNGRTKEGGGHAPSNPLLSSPNPIVP